MSSDSGIEDSTDSVASDTDDDGGGGGGGVARAPSKRFTNPAGKGGSGGKNRRQL
jgi:hypothetical protein